MIKPTNQLFYELDSFFSALLPVVAVLWPIIQYVDSRKKELNLKEFENYHRMIKDIVQPEITTTGNEMIYVDRQPEIIFELRHFKRNNAFSYRTLIGLRDNWMKNSNQYPRLMDELDLTVEYLKNKEKC